MLYADKRALETNLQVSLLKIREKELQFYTQNCIAIGTQAALLSGFAYNGIIQVDIPSESSDWLKTCYLCVTTFAMGFELIAVLNSTLCSMLGPGLALRGPDGSMHRAVDGLMLEYRLTFLFFTMGLIAFHISALLFAWLEFSWPVALAMTLALLMFIYGMGRCTRSPTPKPAALSRVASARLLVTLTRRMVVAGTSSASTSGSHSTRTTTSRASSNLATRPTRARSPAHGRRPTRDWARRALALLHPMHRAHAQGMPMACGGGLGRGAPRTHAGMPRSPNGWPCAASSCDPSAIIRCSRAGLRRCPPRARRPSASEPRKRSASLAWSSRPRPRCTRAGPAAEAAEVVVGVAGLPLVAAASGEGQQAGAWFNRGEGGDAWQA